MLHVGKVSFKSTILFTPKVQRHVCLLQRVGDKKNNRKLSNRITAIINAGVTFTGVDSLDPLKYSSSHNGRLHPISSSLNNSLSYNIRIECRGTHIVLTGLMFIQTSRRVTTRVSSDRIHGEETIVHSSNARSFPRIRARSACIDPPLGGLR